jgi:hypothetical protein
MFTKEEIRIANATYRSKGSSVFDKNGNVRSVVARFVASSIGKDKNILNFGCGSEFIQGKYLRKLGFNVSGWDFGNNKPENCVEKLERVYDVVYASNVLNVISSRPMLMETLEQIKGCLIDNGVFIANFPQSPRKMQISSKELSKIIKERFGGEVKQISNISSPMWIFTKTNDDIGRTTIGA